MYKFFYPDSIAIIGASPRAENLGRNIVINLKTYGFKGPVYCFSPQGGKIENQLVYTSINQFPQVPDLAVILTPASTVPNLLEACGKKGIKRVIIESGGFSELDNNGTALETKLKLISSQYNLRFIGPNCIGALCVQSGVAVPFARLYKTIPKGPLSIIAQSGGVGLTYLHKFTQEGIGISKFISIGNKVDVNEKELLAYLLNDPDTSIILLYLESLIDAHELCDLIKNNDKPVVIHKANIAKISHSIAYSHTAALANDDTVVEEIFKQVGAIRALSITNCINIIKTLTMPKPKGRRIAVISRSGGLAVIAADAIHRVGLELSLLPNSYLESIQKYFRGSVIKLQNPLDLSTLSRLDLFIEILHSILLQDNVDAIVVILAHYVLENKEHQNFLIQASDLYLKYNKPVALIVFTELRELTLMSNKFKLPLFTDIDETLLALSISANFSTRYLPKQSLISKNYTSTDIVTRLKPILSNVYDDFLELPEALLLISSFDIPVAPFIVASNIQEAINAAAYLGFPITLKAVGKLFNHKTEQNGIILNLNSKAAVKNAATHMFKTLSIKRLVVMRMITNAQEVIIGIKQDSSFGSLILFGLGGITAEVIKDISIRLAPVDEVIAGNMFDSLKAIDLLKGYRNQPIANRTAIIQTIIKVSKLAHSLPQLLELDLNPVLSNTNNTLVVDVRARIQSSIK